MYSLQYELRRVRHKELPVDLKKLRVVVWALPLSAWSALWALVSKSAHRADQADRGTDKKLQKEKKDKETGFKLKASFLKPGFKVESKFSQNQVLS